MDRPARLLAPTRLHHDDSAPESQNPLLPPFAGDGKVAPGMLANFSNTGCLTRSCVSQHNGRPDSDWSKLQPYDLYSSGRRLGHAN